MDLAIWIILGSLTVLLQEFYAKEELEFGTGAGHLLECSGNVIHCVLKSGNVTGVIDINGVINPNLELMFEDSYATSDVKCIIVLPWSSETASSLDGSTLHVTLMYVGSTDVLGNFSVPLLFIPDDNKDCRCQRSAGSGHGAGLQDNMETGLYFDDEESMTDIHGLTYHYWTSSHTTYTVNVFANAISVRNDAKFDEYCTRRKVITSMSCFLKFVDISNIPNGTMIDIVMGNGAGEVVKAIRSFISKPPEIRDGPCLGGASSVKATQAPTVTVQSSTGVQSSANCIHNSLYFVMTSITLALLVMYITQFNISYS